MDVTLEPNANTARNAKVASHRDSREGHQDY
jgi:hypothetical protein